jgi:NAD(P)-dependent dehydrogenase (short-subunit alcohol dehydrogenase family)
MVARGEQVIAVCRQSNADLAGLGLRVEEGVDVTEDESVGRFARALEGEVVDLLVHNAGVLQRETLDALDFDSIRLQFEVNSLGPLRVTAALRPCLRSGSKIAIVTSRMGSIGDNTSGSRYGYRMSKAAANMAGVSLSHDLRAEGIAVAILHPGYVRTGMTGGMGNIDPPEAAAGLVERIDALTMENSGSFWHANGALLPW